MVVSEKSLRRLRDFLIASAKVKHRFTSLESFHEYANELEIAEFYEENSELMFLFLFECYLLMIGKTWVIPGDDGGEKEKDYFSDSEARTIEFAFGNELLCCLEVCTDDQTTSGNYEIGSDTTTSLNTNINTNTNTNTNKFIKKLTAQCKKIHPTNSELQNKWIISAKRESNVELFLKFPVIFSKLLQYVSTGRILSSNLAPFLVGMIKRLLHSDNLAVLRFEGLKMLLNLLKSASHEPSHEITKDCIIIFNSLVDIEALSPASANSASPIQHPLPSVIAPPLVPQNLSEFEGPACGVNEEMLIEIFSFITWDSNPDLHSTRFLYNLLKDSFLSKLFPIAYETEKIVSSSTEKEFDVNIKSSVLGIIVDYFSLWFLKSGTKTFKFGSSLLSSSSSTESTNHQNKNQFGSVVSLVVNDISNFLGIPPKHPNSSTSRASMKASSPSEDQHVNEFPVASFLLEEVILGSKKDVVFVHFILKSACYTLKYSCQILIIKLVLEIFRSWLFNPTARRPNFLQDQSEMDGFIEFYLDSLEGLFPAQHLKPADLDYNYEDLQVTLPDRVNIYREAVYFFRALALQAFFPLSLDRWLHLLRIENEVVEMLLEPANLLERPFFVTEDALLAETLFGSLLRCCEYFSSEEAMRAKWIESSRILAKCSACPGVIEVWCRVIEELANLLVKDPRYSSQLQAQQDLTKSKPTSPEVISRATSNLSSSGSLPPMTSSFSAWPELPSVKGASVLLFRNVLRILGDPAGSLTELKINRPDLMALAYESMERCLGMLMKCRLDQPVKIPLYCVPPIGDLLPAALSALLHLKSYNSNISMKISGESTRPQVAHDSSRIIAWKIAGTIMFRPMDVIIPDHYWGALLVAARDCLNDPLSVSEFTAFMLYVGLPVSTAQVPGASMILTEIVDAMLRFFNDTLWSGNSSSAFSAGEAFVLIPVVVKIISNSLKLAKIFPKQFGHFRDDACLMRLLQNLIATVSDGQLLTVIHTALAEIYCSECVAVDNELVENVSFAQSVLELMLEGPFKFSRTKSHVHVINCLCEYLSALAHLKISAGNIINDEFITKKMIEAVMIGANVEDYSEALVSIVQGPLSDWILYAHQGRLSGDLKTSVCALFDLKFASKSVKSCVDQFAVRLLTFSSAFPGSLGPKYIGSERMNCGRTVSLISLALTPSQTILSFESDTLTGDLFVIMRNCVGKFVWKMRDIWTVDSNNLDTESSKFPNKLESEFEKCDDSIHVEGLENVVDDSEFPLPHISQKEKDIDREGAIGGPFEVTDVLKNLLESLKEKFPKAVKSNPFDQGHLDLDEKSWRDQCNFEAQYKGENAAVSEITRFERKRPVITSERFSVQLRLLLCSLSLTVPELYTAHPAFGIQVLKGESSSGAVTLEEEFGLLDGISGRFKVKIGCIYLSEGICEESELFSTNQNQPRVNDRLDHDHQCYRDFFDSFVEESSSSLYTPQNELEIDELDHLKSSSSEGNSFNMKKHLGNDSVLVIWHGKNGDTLVEGAPFKSDVTAAIIRIRSHVIIPGQYIVTLQTCYEKLMQPRKYARVRVDPFTLAEIDENLELEVDGVFFGARGGSVQRDGILVPLGSLGAIVRALACAAWRQAHLINCIRSAGGTGTSGVINLTAQNRLKYSPDTVRRDRIEEIIKRYGMADLPYEKFLSSLFQ